jgi:hypothetical protein
MHHEIAERDLNRVGQFIPPETLHIPQHFDSPEAVAKRCFDITNHRTSRLGIENGPVGDPLDMFRKLAVACDVEIFARERTIARQFPPDAIRIVNGPCICGLSTDYNRHR